MKNPMTKFTLAALAIVTVYLVVLFLLAYVIYLQGQREATPRCADYKTQPEAQAAYDSNPQKYATLDKGGDGNACTALPKK